MKKRGLFEVADGGTVFLDEVSEMSDRLQAKLLQVLDDQSFRRTASCWRRSSGTSWRAHGSLPRAAKLLGITKDTLRYRVKQFELKPRVVPSKS